MAIVSLAGIVLYFVTSSDSGSLVIDSLSANGHPGPPILQRISWALTEGGCATGLLWVGGKDSLNALRVGYFYLHNTCFSIYKVMCNKF